MAKSKLKYNKRDLTAANRSAVKLIQDIIKTKRRSDGHTIQKRTGDLLRNIKPVFKLVNEELYIDISVMEYYKYLDEGTKRIKPWFLTEEIMSDDRMLGIINKLVADAAKAVIIDVVSDINKIK
jgi:hypothetical protein